MSQDINVVALVKGEERYIFLFNDAQRGRKLRTLGRWRSNSETSFRGTRRYVLMPKSSQRRKSPRFPDPLRDRFRLQAFEIYSRAKHSLTVVAVSVAVTAVNRSVALGQYDPQIFALPKGGAKLLGVDDQVLPRKIWNCCSRLTESWVVFRNLAHHSARFENLCFSAA